MRTTYIDMTGQTINGVAILKYKETVKGNAIWYGKCTICGSEKEYTRQKLQRKATKGCGCKYKRINPRGMYRRRD